MAIFYAEVRATVLLDWHYIPEGASGAIVRYLLAAPDISTAVSMVQWHAFDNYLEEGEIYELYEIEYSDAITHPITVERNLNINDPELFEILLIGSYKFSLSSAIARAKRWLRSKIDN